MGLPSHPPRDLNGFDDGPNNQFGLFEVDTAMAAFFRDDEFGSRDLVHPFLVKLQPDRHSRHLSLLDFVEIF
jgi:hypothetical protein